MADTEIIERIRKLLALAGRATNEHEAASAAARAAELMTKHEITEAVVRATDGTRTAEEIVEGAVTGTDGQRRVAWKCFIASGAAKAFGIEMWFVGARCVGLGRKSAVQSWDYTCQYLYREVDRLADAAWDGEPGELPRWNDVSARSWKNAFRVGAAHAIRRRLREQAASAEASKRADVAEAAALTGPDTANQTGRETMALAIIDRERAEVLAAYEARSKNFGKATAIGNTSSAAGYMAGVRAGRKVDLGGNARGGLPAPAKAIQS